MRISERKSVRFRAPPLYVRVDARSLLQSMKWNTLQLFACAKVTDYSILFCLFPSHRCRVYFYLFFQFSSQRNCFIFLHFSPVQWNNIAMKSEEQGMATLGCVIVTFFYIFFFVIHIRQGEHEASERDQVVHRCLKISASTGESFRKKKCELCCLNNLHFFLPFSSRCQFERKGKTPFSGCETRIIIMIWVKYMLVTQHLWHHHNQRKWIEMARWIRRKRCGNVACPNRVLEEESLCLHSTVYSTFIFRVARRSKRK